MFDGIGSLISAGAKAVLGGKGGSGSTTVVSAQRLSLPKESSSLPCGCTSSLATLVDGIAADGHGLVKLLGGEWALLTRNGPFFSSIFVVLGAELRARHWRITVIAQRDL